MAAPNKIKRLIAYLAPRVGVKTWFFTLLKDNLAVKLGTAIAVWPVATIILATMVAADRNPIVGSQPASIVTKQMAVKLSELSSVSNQWWLMSSLIVVGCLWTATIVTRGLYRYVKIENPLIFGFSQSGWLFGSLSQFLMGVLLVPFVIIWALLIHIPHLAKDITLASTITFTLVYIVLVSAMQYLSSIDKEVTNSVIYIVHAPNVDAKAASLLMLDTINNKHNGLIWLGSPEVVSLSNDGVVVLTLPILYNAEHWRKDESKQLKVMLKQTEDAWTDLGYSIRHCEIPKKFR